MISDEEVSPGAVRQIREMWEFRTQQWLGPRWNAAFTDWIKKFGLAQVTDAVQKASVAKYSAEGELIAPNVLNVRKYAAVEQAEDNEPGMGECYLVRGRMRVKFFSAEHNDGDVLALLKKALRAGVSTSAMHRAVDDNHTLEDCFVSLGIDRVEFRIAMGQTIVDLVPPKGRVFVREEDPEWPIWNAYLLKTTGKGSPMNKRFGWYFPSRLPPVEPSSRTRRTAPPR